MDVDEPTHIATIDDRRLAEPEVRRRILIGAYVLSAGYYDAYYRKAQQVRALIARDFEQAFERCDVILTPTCPFEAFAVGDKADDPIAMYLNDVLTVPGRYRPTVSPERAFEIIERGKGHQFDPQMVEVLALVVQ